MLLSLVLKLEAQKDGRIPLTHGDLVHAALLDIIKNNLPENEAFLAWQLHEFQRAKPFTVSHLFGNHRMDDHQLIIQTENYYHLRITSLNKTLSECLLALKDKSTNPLKIGEVFFNIEEVITEESVHGQAKQSSFEELVKSWSEAEIKLPRKLVFRFISPTCFRDGTQNIIFPLPHLVFFSLAEKWQKYAPELFNKEIRIFQDEMKVWQEKSKGQSNTTTVWELLDKLVNVSAYKLRTRMLNFREYKRVGFTGIVEFQVQPSVPDKWLRLLNLLADFSFYAGIGYQTTMAMGQAQRVLLDKKFEEMKGEQQ